MLNMIDIKLFMYFKQISKLVFVWWLAGSLTQVNAQCDCGRIDQLEKLLRNETSTRKRIDVFNELSAQYFATKQKVDIPKARKYANEALNKARESNYKKGKAAALFNKANVNYDVSRGEGADFNTTVSLYDQARALYEEIGDKQGLARVYEGLGNFYYANAYLTSSNNTNTRKAVEYLEKAELIREELLKKSNLSEEQKEYERNQIGTTLSKLSEIYSDGLGEDDKALEFHERANQILGENDDNIQAQLGNIYRKRAEEKNRKQNQTLMIVLIGVALLLLLAVGLVVNIGRTQKKNRLLGEQRAKLARTNKMIEEKNELIEAKNQQMESHNQELAELNKKMNRVNKEVELTNFELNEKNEEIKQTAEALKQQSDALENQKLKLEKAYETITLLSQVGQDLTASLDFEKTLNTLQSRVKEMMPVDGFTVSILDTQSNELHVRFAAEFGDRKPTSSMSMDDTHHPAVWCVKNNHQIIINQREDLHSQSFYDTSLHESFNSMMYYPMLHEDKVIGAVSVQSRLIAAYTPYYADIFKTLVLYASIAISNAENYRTLNGALNNLKTTQDQLVEAEKMASLGNLVAGVAHEINTPVGIGVTAASRLDSKTKEFSEVYKSGKMKRTDLEKFLQTNQEGTKIILNNLDRAAKLVQGFKQVAVGQSNEEKQKFNLKVYLEDTLIALQPKLKNKPYTLDVDIDDLTIESYSGAYSQIVTNLVMNSIIHGFKDREEGKISLSVKANGDRVKMVYSDDGNGIAPEIIDKVFDPFVTTNREGGGTGLGMNILYNIVVQQLKGKVEFKTAVNEGVTFVFDLPMNV